VREIQQEVYEVPYWSKTKAFIPSLNAHHHFAYFWETLSDAQLSFLCAEVIVNSLICLDTNKMSPVLIYPFHNVKDILGDFT